MQFSTKHLYMRTADSTNLRACSHPTICIGEHIRIPCVCSSCQPHHHSSFPCRAHHHSASSPASSPLSSPECAPAGPPAPAAATPPAGAGARAATASCAVTILRVCARNRSQMTSGVVASSGRLSSRARTPSERQARRAPLCRLCEQRKQRQAVQVRPRTPSVLEALHA